MSLGESGSATVPQVTEDTRCSITNFTQQTVPKCVSFFVPHNSGPQPFWYQGPVSWKTILPWTGGASDGSGGNASDGGDGSRSNASDGSGGNAKMGSDGERPMKLRSLAHRSPPAVRPGS